jgi:general secretion pathway protein H
VVARPHGRRSAAAAAGFTLIELLLVLVLMAMASGLVALTLRDGEANRLDHEATRLAALLEAGRAASRASGLAVSFVLGKADSTSADDFRFAGLPPGTTLPTRWLDPQVHAQLAQGGAVVLGPEPLIGAQRIVLRLDDQRLTLATDGIGPFATVDEPVTASR